MSKKMMIKPSYLLMSIFAFLFLIGFASALNSPDWTQYSPQYNWITNTQDTNSQGYLNGTISKSTATFYYSGLSVPSEQLFPIQLVTKTIGSSQYAVLTDSSYLSVYNSNLVKQASVLSGNQIYSLALFGSTDNQTLKIVGLFQNGTSNYFGVYAYDTIANTLTLSAKSGSVGTAPSGIKCIQNGLTYFGYNGIACLGFVNGIGSSWNITNYYEDGSIFSKVISSVSGTSAYSPRTPSFADVNGDGKLEVLGYTDISLWLMNRTGDVTFRRDRTTGYNYADADFFLDTPSTYKIVFTENQPSGSSYTLSYLTLAGATFNGVSGTTIVSGGSANTIRAGQMSVLDWNGDGISEIAVPYSNTTSTLLKLYDVSGTLLKTGFFNTPVYDAFVSSGITQRGHVISAKLNGDSYYDFIFSSNTNNTLMFALDLQNNVKILNSSGNFIPVDFNSDGAVELLGFNTTQLTLIKSSTYTNQNAVLNTLTFLPSITPAISSPMTITMSATDFESDVIYYHVDCGNGVVTSETTSNSAQCTYSSTGDAYLTAYVRDGFHATYSSYSQLISVGGVTGNGTGITQPDENTTTITSTGGMTLPTQLVNTENINQGLLPEIYFGTLAFFSSILTPTIVLVFVIFFALIMVTIGMIIKKIADKVGSMGR